MADLYRAHLDTLMQRYQASLERCGFDAVIISAGVAEKVRDDDHAYPYIRALSPSNGCPKP